MRRKHLFVLIGCLALITSLTSFSTAEPKKEIGPPEEAKVPDWSPPSEAGTTGGNIVQALNPMGTHMPLEVQGLAPRIDTIEGKTIWVHQGEADPVIMPALLELLRADYPNTDWRYIGSSDFGPRQPEAEVLAEADAVIKGVAW